MSVRIELLRKGAEHGFADLADFEIYYTVLDADSPGEVWLRENDWGRSYANFKFLGIV